MLALLPAVVVAVCVRVLTLTHPPVAARAAAAAGVAAAAWIAYRLLTVRLTVADDGIHVRGVWYEADIDWADVQAGGIAPATPALRALLWGVMAPQTLELRTTRGTLRPLVAVGPEDDDDLRRAATAVRLRIAGWTVPAQRSPDGRVTRV